MNQLYFFCLTTLLAAGGVCLVSHDRSSTADRMQPIVGKAIATKIDIGIEISIKAPKFKYSLEKSRVGNSALELEFLKTEKSDLKFSVMLVGESGTSEKADYASSLVDIDDNPVALDSIIERLKAESPVIICLDGQMPDEDFLQIMKDDLLILKIGPLDANKMRELVPGRLAN
ncbi:MAG TPA: hypothetical protein PKD64_19760 [Pirellulaceae bacterium]|nr:hypothetical protein [Pirellulaceae bacterium]